MDEGSTYSEGKKQRLANQDITEYNICANFIVTNHTFAAAFSCSAVSRNFTSNERLILLPILSIDQKFDIFYCSLSQQSS
jgi:hypothetical protein